MRNTLAKKIQQGWSDPNILTYLLLPLSLLYMAIMWLRKVFYKNNLFHVYQAGVPVLIVGNISVGGTGKTPLTMAIVERARSLGYTPGVISRGYGGQALEWPQVVTPETSAHFVGDESVLIAHKTGCPVVVGPNRGETIDMLLSKYPCDLIISDDGLQHYALARNAEIAVLDKQRRHLNKFCLPAGPLRESIARLKSVDLIMNHVAPVERSSDDVFDESELSLFRLQHQGIKCVLNHKLHQLDDKTTIHAVAGIGHPIRFFRQLRALGFNVVEHAFPDHHRYSAEDFDFVGNDYVIMTAKDAVKCASFAADNWYYLAVEVELNRLASTKLDKLLLDLKANVAEAI